MASEILFFALIVHVVCALKILFDHRYGLIGVAFFSYHIFFLIVPGLFHFSVNSFPFYGMSYTQDARLVGAILVLVFSIFFYIGFFTVTRRGRLIDTGWALPLVRKKRALALCFLFVVIQVIVVAVFGMSAFVLRREEFTRAVFSDVSALSNFVIEAVRAVSFLTLLVSIHLFIQKRRILQVTCVLASATMFMVCNYPLSLPRFVLFGYVLAVIYLFFGVRQKVKFFISGSVALGITTIFPLFSILTRGDFSSLRFGIDYYQSSADFDGMQSILNAVRYVDDNSLAWGQQLFGSMFFFIPRAIWTGKPLPTGELTAQFVGYDYTNISSPLISEYYVDFGYVGVALLALLTGFLLSKLDRWSVEGARRTLTSVYVGAIVFSYLIIILRGPLMGAAAPVVISVVFAILTTKLIRSSNGTRVVDTEQTAKAMMVPASS